MGVYTRQLYDNTLYINKIQKTLLSELLVGSTPSWGSHPTQTKKGSITASFSAESEGFEPPDPLRSTVFKTAAFDHSANSPICFPRKGMQRYELFRNLQIFSHFFVTDPALRSG